ncbi:hypothetical protein OPQ81_011858 [Rhizoctonia solani]|nr:hypothetical protein OPQ81_011858 [Rhizoctonia solani]
MLEGAISRNPNWDIVAEEVAVHARRYGTKDEDFSGKPGFSRQHLGLIKGEKHMLAAALIKSKSHLARISLRERAISSTASLVLAFHGIEDEPCCVEWTIKEPARPPEADSVRFPALRGCEVAEGVGLWGNGAVNGAVQSERVPRLNRSAANCSSLHGEEDNEDPPRNSRRDLVGAARLPRQRKRHCTLHSPDRSRVMEALW